VRRSARKSLRAERSLWFSRPGSMSYTIISLWHWILVGLLTGAQWSNYLLAFSLPIHLSR
jgi:hypothetical protein